MMRRLFFALLLTAAAGTTGGPQAFAGDYEDFLDRYASHHEKTTNHFLKNIKATGKRVRYDHYIRPIVAFVEEDFTVIADNNRLLCTLKQVGLSGLFQGKSNTSGGYVDSNCSFTTQFEHNGPSKFLSGRPSFPWEPESAKFYPPVHNGSCHPLNCTFLRVYIGRGPNRYYRPDPVHGWSGCAVQAGSTFSVGSEVRDGVDRIAVRLKLDRDGRKQAHTFYLDRRNYVVVARETVGLFNMTLGRYEPIRRVEEISYGPAAPDTGLPFPTAVKTTYHMPDGKTLPGESVTFTEYRRYTPTPDEVGVEKVLKVKMPAIPPRPPLPPEGQYLDPDRPGELLPAARRSGRTAWPWYAGGSVLAVASVTLGLLFRRRRRAVP